MEVTVDNQLKYNDSEEDNQKDGLPKRLSHIGEILIEVNKSQIKRINDHVSALENSNCLTKICKTLYPVFFGALITSLLQFFCNGKKTEWIIASFILLALSALSYIIKYKKDNNDANAIIELRRVIDEVIENTPELKLGSQKIMTEKRKSGDLTSMATVFIVFMPLCVLHSCNINSSNDINQSIMIVVSAFSVLTSLTAILLSLKERRKRIDYEKNIEKYTDFNDIEVSKAFFVMGNSMAASSNWPDAIVYYTKAIKEAPQNPEYYEKRAEAYSRMMCVEDAQIDYEKAIDLYKQEDTDKFKISQLLHELANLYIQDKDYKNAENCYVESIDIYKEKGHDLSDSQLGELVSVLNDYGNMLTNNNKITEAELMFKKASENCSRMTNGAEKTMASEAMTLNNMAVLYKKNYQFDLALEKYEEALSLYQQLAKLNEYKYIPDVSMTLNNMGNLHVSKSDYNMAETEFVEALKIRRELAEHDEETYNPNVASTLNNLANLYNKIGKYNEAEDSYKEALSIRQRLASKNPDVFMPEVAMTLNNLANLYNSTNRIEEAEKIYLEALEIINNTKGLEHPDTASTYNNIGSLYYNKGNYDKALEYYFKALAIREKVLGTEHPDTATSYNNIGAVYDDKGDYDKALEYYFKDLAICENVLGTEHPDTASSYNNIAGVYYSQGDYGKALEYYFKALEIKVKVLGTEHPSTATSYNNIGAIYKAQGDYGKALEYYFKALAIREKVLGTEHPSTATSYNNIGGVYDEQGDYGKALEYYFKDLAICEKVFGTEHPDTATSYNNIARVYYALDDYDKALEYLSKAYQIYEKVLGPEHPNTRNVLVGIEIVKKAMKSSH